MENRLISQQKLQTTSKAQEYKKEIDEKKKSQILNKKREIKTIKDTNDDKDGISKELAELRAELIKLKDAQENIDRGKKEQENEAIRKYFDDKQNPLSVEHTTLTNKSIGPEGAIALSKNITWSNLRSLTLDTTQLDAEGVRALSKNTVWSRLSLFELQSNNLGPEAAVALSKNTSWTNLERLVLFNNGIGDQGVAALIENTSWKNLKILELSRTSIGVNEVASLSKSSCWRTLLPYV